MKKIMIAFLGMIFALGALSITGCSNDFHDEEPARGEDAVEKYFLFGYDGMTANYPFEAHSDDNDYPQWLTVTGCNATGGWGSNEKFKGCIVLAKKADITADDAMWKILNDGHHRWGLALNDPNPVDVPAELTLGNEDDGPMHNNNFSFSGDMETTYTIKFNPSNSKCKIVTGDGKSDAPIEAPKKAYIYPTSGLATAKLVETELEKKGKVFETTVDISADATSLVFTLIYDGHAYGAANGTVSASAITLTAGKTTAFTKSIITAERGKKCKISLDTSSDPKLTVKIISTKRVEDEIAYVCSNYGNKDITWSEPSEDGTSYGTVVFSVADTECSWSKSTIEFGATKNTSWDNKYVDATLKLNGDWTELTKGGTNNNKVEGTPGNGLKQDYILALKSTTEGIYAKITPVWNFMIPNSCVTEIEGEGSPFGGQNYPAKANDGGIRSYKFTVKDDKCTAWTCNDFIPFAILNVKGIKADGNWDTDGGNSVTKYWKGDVTVGTNATEVAGVSLADNVVGNKGIKSATIGDTLTITVKLTESSGSATAAKAWIVKQ